MKASRKTFLRALIVLGALVVFGEIGLRLFEAMAVRRLIDPQDAVIDLATINYNAGQVARNKEKDEFRVLSFGDSQCLSIFTQEKNYNGVAERELGRTAPGKTVRVVNLGEPAASVHQYMAGIRHWTKRLDYDAIVVNIFLGDDLTDVSFNLVPVDAPVNRLLAVYSMDIQTGAKRLRFAPREHYLRLVDYAGFWLRAWGEGTQVLRPEISSGYNFIYGPLDGETLEKINAIYLTAADPAKAAKLAPGLEALDALGRMLEEQVRSQGKAAVVLLTPAEVLISGPLLAKTAARAGLDPARLEPGLPARLVSERLAKAAPDVPVLDLTAPLRQAMERGESVFEPKNVHLGEAGNRIAGEELAKSLAAAAAR